MNGLYIHIPFCKSKCIYCDFCSYTSDEYVLYTNALIIELSLYAKKYPNFTIDTIYFGGGTPTILPIDCVTKIINAIYQNFHVSLDAEITTEMNPNSATKEKISQLVDLGFNRYSVGLQCSNDKILKFLGRPHNLQDFYNTLDALNSSSVDNISVDIMLGVPYQTRLDIDKSLQIIDDYNIKHISAYSLIVESKTPLYKMVKKGLVLPDSDETVDLYDYLLFELNKRDIFRYEISNFAKRGYECKHNLIYWNCNHYIGVGVNASGYLKNTRYTNVRKIDNYINKCNSQKLPISSSTSIDKQSQMYEYVMLKLRLSSGIDKAEFFDKFHIDFFEAYKKAQALLNKNVLLDNNGRVVIADKYLYVQSEVLLEILY